MVAFGETLGILLKRGCALPHVPGAPLRPGFGFIQMNAL